MKKKKTGIMLYPNTLQQIEDTIHLANTTSRNNFVEDAINFYIGYLTSNTSNNYLTRILNQTLDSKLSILEELLSSILYKTTVELNIIMNIIAATVDIDINTLERLRIKSMDDVKRTVGKIDLEEIFKSYSREDGD